MKKVAIGILGATGVIGEEYLRLLKNHPWFEIAFLAASEKRVATLSPLGLPYSSIEDINTAKKRCSLVFSALPSSLSQIEERYAEVLPLLSHNATHRMKKGVPLVIPEINPDHLELLKGKKGYLLAKPNCALFSFLLPLAPLFKLFPVDKIHVTTLQAISGAGLNALAAMEIHNNVIPYIGSEEEKLESEPLKILGTLQGDEILPAAIAISAHCNRVPVLHGHFACVSLAFKKKPTSEEILEMWRHFNPLASLELPSAPKQPIHYLEEPNRPQTRLDLNAMGVTVGRLRPCPLLDFRFVGLSHNAIRGGAGGGLLLAELLHNKGLV